MPIMSFNIPKQAANPKPAPAVLTNGIFSALPINQTFSPGNPSSQLSNHNSSQRFNTKQSKP